MQAIRKLAAIPILVLIYLTNGAATTIEKLSIEKMAGLAHAIVRARCISVSARWDRGEIWTFTSFQVSETWKGQAPDDLVVRLLGGSVGSLTSTVAGIPRFRPNEEVILFLQQTSDGDFTVLSWEQGAFRIGRDRRTGTEMVTEDTATFETYDPRTHQFSATGMRDTSLDALRARVRAAISQISENEP